MVSLVMKMGRKVILSFLSFVLLTALIHIGVLTFTAIKNGDIKYLNYFQILGLNEFWPKIANGWISNVISISLMVIIMGGFLVSKIILDNRGRQIDRQ